MSLVLAASDGRDKLVVQAREYRQWTQTLTVELILALVVKNGEWRRTYGVRNW
jgi:hypothetical protein